MARKQRVLDAVLNGRSDSNIGFSDLRKLLKSFGFEERICGSHHIFTRAGVDEILNIQPKGSKSKPYQVKQVRHVIIRYKLMEAGDTNAESEI